jgi:SAM-dependent methyltransferase
MQIRFVFTVVPPIRDEGRAILPAAARLVNGERGGRARRGSSRDELESLPVSECSLGEERAYLAHPVRSKSGRGGPVDVEEELHAATLGAAFGGVKPTTFADNPAMPRRNPEHFPRDDRRVYDSYIAGRQSAVLAAAVRIGLFDLLEKSPLAREAICERLGTKARPTDAMLAALFAMGLLRRDDTGVHSLSPDASDYLVRGKPGCLAGLIDLEIENFLSPAILLEALREGRPSVYGGGDPWAEHEADPQKAERFTAAMHSISERPAAGLAETVDFTDVRRVLDVGGGSGALSLAIASAWPEVECVIWDLPVVCGIVGEYAEAAGLGDRVTPRPGDMFQDPFPAGFDAILLSQILHDWPRERDRELLAKARAALAPGGRVLVHEKLVEDDGSGPLANALVNLDMLVWTEGQQLSGAEVREMLSEAGFERIETAPTAGYWSVVTGWRA